MPTNKQNIKFFRQMLKRRGEIHADSKLRGWNFIHKLLRLGSTQADLAKKVDQGQVLQTLKQVVNACNFTK